MKARFGISKKLSLAACGLGLVGALALHAQAQESAPEPRSAAPGPAPGPAVDAAEYRLAGTTVIAPGGIVRARLVESREVNVFPQAWPDYVFEKDYAPMPLAEVERSIAERGHLPGMPARAEVLAHGVDVGRMQVLLLEKIEELTLHVIAQDKELQRLRRNNGRLSAGSR